MKSKNILFFQNLNNVDYVMQVIKFCQEILKDSITLIEHKFIIQKFLNTKYLDRRQAIEIYKKFNIENPEYLIEINFYLLFYPNNCVNLEKTFDQVIVENLSLQLLYFCFKTSTKYLNKYYYQQ